MYLDPVSYVAMMLLYILGLVLVYRKGRLDMKSNYSELIGKLHRRYSEDLVFRSDLLEGLDDIEDCWKE
ncbi:hypothetical protein GF319_15420 [Candidatus Bathyarchaeota archaeon]|nr:hypothetical protein [Candidatus Bathyarchaeota archaeon]